MAASGSARRGRPRERIEKAFIPPKPCERSGESITELAVDDGLSAEHVKSRTDRSVRTDKTRRATTLVAARVVGGLGLRSTDVVR